MLHCDIYIKVREIVNDGDPIGLMGICGEDEYSPEIKDIIMRMDDCRNFAEMLFMVLEVFEGWFSMTGPIEANIKIAEKLCELQKDYKIHQN
jgi:F0F1-type ATP synthase beta subunit